MKLSEIERRQIDNAYDMLRGCMNRMCITDDVYEFESLYKSAGFHLKRLFELNKKRLFED